MYKREVRICTQLGAQMPTLSILLYPIIKGSNPVSDPKPPKGIMTP